MTILRHTLHDALIRSREEKHVAPLRIPGLSHERVQSELCDDVFLIRATEVYQAIRFIEEENIERLKTKTPLERSLCIFHTVDIEGTPSAIIHQFDLEAVRAACRMLSDKYTYGTRSGIVTVDNGHLEEGTLIARVIIYDDENTATEMMHAALYGCGALLEA